MGDLRVADLCSGVGGLSLAVSLATGGRGRTVVYVEREVSAAPTPCARDSKGAQTGHRVGLPRQIASWPTVVESDSRSSGRHTTTANAMHPGTWLTDALRSFDASSSTSGPPDPKTAKAGTPGLVLNPAFVETLMGYPGEWTDVDGLGRPARVSLMGNSVVPQCAAAALLSLVP